MSIPIYQVDAFAEKPFAGNPAAVCVLQKPADEAWMQAVAREMNLSETAFVVPRDDNGFDLRWFTPAIEVPLCGHATLAASHILWETGMLPPSNMARFHTQSGLLQASLIGGLIELDFPALQAKNCRPPNGLLDALGLQTSQNIAQAGFRYLVEVDSAERVRKLTPDFSALRRAIGEQRVIVTASSDQSGFDIVSRYFAPGVGVDEDPVTGSAHCALAPYWAAKLGKSVLTAYQASARGGKLQCTLAGDRVKLAGKALTVLSGELTV
jgi:PhzF family phenazine biosynthesis protein